MYLAKLQILGFVLLAKARKYNDPENQEFPVAGIYLENFLEKTR
jgi:hypothetical protein